MLAYVPHTAGLMLSAGASVPEQRFDPSRMVVNLASEDIAELERVLARLDVAELVCMSRKVNLFPMQSAAPNFLMGFRACYLLHAALQADTAEFARRFDAITVRPSGCTRCWVGRWPGC